MNHQKHCFSLPDHITYFNAAYMSPSLKTVSEAGYQGVRSKDIPYSITSEDFFKNRQLLKEQFARLIDIKDAEGIAVVPSVSYGIATVASNIDFKTGDEILVVEEQFPSNIYSWQEAAKEKGAIIKIVAAPESLTNRGKVWNERILEAINSNTKVVSICQIHWADGTYFDLKAIREKTKLHEALLIVDGTQSVGAYPFSVKEIQPDALICGAYKWLLGPYGIGLAYYGDYFHQGNPIEHNWLNRAESEDFSKLVHYNSQYQPKAGRFNAGGSSNFILVPMFNKALEQLLDWEVANIQQYCKKISHDAIETWRDLGYFIEEDKYRGHHLIGIYPSDPKIVPVIKEQLEKAHIYASVRGKAVRVSPHVYNTEEDFNKLSNCLKKVL